MFSYERHARADSDAERSCPARDDAPGTPQTGSQRLAETVSSRAASPGFLALLPTAAAAPRRRIGRRASVTGRPVRARAAPWILLSRHLGRAKRARAAVTPAWHRDDDAGTAMSPQPTARQRADTRSARAWQRMLSGRRLDLLDPSPLDVEIEDIAHGLARVARWNGQTTGPHIFSVAQHTLLVEAIARRRTPALDRRARLAILLHDAAEYVIGDMISPFKAVIGDAYKAVEARLLAAIRLRFGLPAELPSGLTRIVKSADQHAAYLEATRLAGFSHAEAKRFFGVPVALPPALERNYLHPWPATEAEARYLARFAEVAPE